eukprot:CAMPEP_0171472078 /NCGR_PEP_ID=MMETSP0946-20130122/1077_1 /TAXON_ID=109269 /ORGANISM="Vaucheria litorea, Strain CCMP2940" /LENGTH=144 /DNA_ID=CAMNT_0012001673 /DNA_START=675 /DNA_END=1106 /DNA_ORIENTATION=+
MTHKANCLVTIIWSFLLFVCVYGTYWAYQDVPSPIPKWLNYMYMTFSKPAWTVGLTALTFQCIARKGGPVQSLLEWNFFAPLARLSFCAYLIHPTIIYWYYKASYIPLRFSEINFAFLFCGATLGTFAASIALYLAVEIPFKRL